jgi:hypothetical protein
MGCMGVLFRLVLLILGVIVLIILSGGHLSWW